MEAQNTPHNRRQFVKRTAIASAGALAFPYVVPSRVLGAEAPSNRINMGCIGLGGQGTGLMNRFCRMKEVQMLAVCDVHRNYGKGSEPAKRGVDAFYAEQMKSGTYKGCAAYGDFRELVARDDIDAVCIATPDHWHALTAIAAANAGQDIYCEKPLANSVGEGRAICEAVKKNERILQTGSHERSNPNARFACELVRNGRIGKLRTIRLNLPCSDRHHKQARDLKETPPQENVPDGFDYDLWLGHTPRTHYTSKRCHFWWRFILAYGGGEMTDRGAHVIDIAQLGSNTDDTGPVEIEAKGVRTEGSLYTAFWDYSFENVYANGVRMIGEAKGPRGLKFEGDKGWVFVHIHGGKLRAEPESLLDEKIDEGETQLGRAPGNDHRRSFIEAVKSREEPTAPAEVGHRTATICHLNNIAMKLGRKLKWDPVKEEVVGDEEANAMLTPQMRAPWHL